MSKGVKNSAILEEVPLLKGTDAGVLFQNADWNINMGVWFDDPDIEIDDIYWYHFLALEIENSLRKNEGLVSVDREYNTKSCYVELHRKSGLSSVKFPLFW